MEAGNEVLEEIIVGLLNDALKENLFIYVDIDLQELNIASIYEECIISSEKRLKQIMHSYVQNKRRWSKLVDNDSDNTEISEWLKNGYHVEFINFQKIKPFMRKTALKKDLERVIIENFEIIASKLKEQRDVTYDKGKLKIGVHEDRVLCVPIMNNIKTPIQYKKGSKGTSLKASSTDGEDIIDSRFGQDFLVNRDKVFIESNNDIVLLNDREITQSANALAKDIMHTKLSLINPTDKEVLREILQYAHIGNPEFLYTGKIEVAMDKLCKGLKQKGIFKNTRIDDLERVFSKLTNIGFRAKNVRAKISILESYVINGNTNTITVFLGNQLKTELMGNLIIYIHNDSFSKLELPSSRELIFALQDRRIRLEVEIRKALTTQDFNFDISFLSKSCCINYQKTNVLRVDLDIDFFKDVFLYKNRRASFIGAIIDSLEELKVKNILISDYSYNASGTTFSVEFKPLSKKEIEIIETETNPYPFLIAESSPLLN